MSAASWTNLVNWKAFRRICARDGCHGTSLRQTFTGRKSGMLLAGQWHCSEECFSEGLVERIRDLRRKADCAPTAHCERIPLELLLLARGLIDQAQLRQAQLHQKSCGGVMSDILRELRFASDRQLADAAASQWGCPVFIGRPEGGEVAIRIPSTLMKMVLMAPVHFLAHRRKLLVGFVHGIEHRVLGMIEEMTDCVTEPCFITASECESVIRRSSGGHLEVVFERLSSEAEMTKIILSYADQIGAEEARLGLCRDHLWARLIREGQPTELVFALAGVANREALRL